MNVLEKLDHLSTLSTGKKILVAAVAGAVFLVMVFGLGAAAIGGGDSTLSAPAPTPSQTVEKSEKVTKEPVQKAKPSPKAEKPKEKPKKVEKPKELSLSDKLDALDTTDVVGEFPAIYKEHALADDWAWIQTSLSDMESADADVTLATRAYAAAVLELGGKSPVKAEPAPVAEPEPPVVEEETVSYENCDDVREAGANPILRGDPGYADHLDREGDGIACE